MKFIEKIEGADTIAIGGHVRPDGDCVGSCMGLFGYLADHYPEKKVCVYLEEIPEAFDYLKIDEAMSGKADKYDLFIALDCGSIDRLGEAQGIFEKAVDTVCVDHHISNTNFAKENIVKANASSTRGSAVAPSARYSTLQDLDAGRHTEIDMFSGALMRMGRELGIPVPYNEFTYHMIKALEEKNDGKFDYDGIKGMTTCAR